MVICDVCKLRPGTTKVSAELVVSQKRQNKRLDICDPCAALNLPIIDAAATTFVTVLSTLKPPA